MKNKMNKFKIQIVVYSLFGVLLLILAVVNIILRNSLVTVVVAIFGAYLSFEDLLKVINEKQKLEDLRMGDNIFDEMFGDEKERLKENEFKWSDEDGNRENR
ncbi:MAG: hypothetical protein PHP08_00780 [Candidatus Dojkabacteria bacterium]|nr:hypothetical protein [Candidatus Dojkabacteria bacterium]